MLLADLADDDQFHDIADEFLAPHGDAGELEQALAGLGIPVAVPVGDMLPDRVDETVDVHEAAVINIEIAQLRRFLRELPPLDGKVMRLVWGIGCRPHTRGEAAESTGLSRVGVRDALTRGMSELRMRFGVEEADGA